VVTREDRELLAELARLNRAMAPLAIRIMDDIATAGEQLDYAQRMITACERLRRRASPAASTVIDGDVLHSTTPTPPPRAAAPRREP
jgi:hypothetical protein